MPNTVYKQLNSVVVASLVAVLFVLSLFGWSMVHHSDSALSDCSGASLCASVPTPQIACGGDLLSCLQVRHSIVQVTSQAIAPMFSWLILLTVLVLFFTIRPTGNSHLLAGYAWRQRWRIDACVAHVKFLNWIIVLEKRDPAPALVSGVWSFS